MLGNILLKDHFGKQLKKLRKKAGLTQEQLADKVELTVESVSNIERGIYGPKFQTLEKLSKALNVEVKELFNF